MSQAAHSGKSPWFKGTRASCKKSLGACISALRTTHPLREVQALVPLVLPPLDDLFTQSLVRIIMLTSWPYRSCCQHSYLRIA